MQRQVGIMNFQLITHLKNNMKKVLLSLLAINLLFTSCDNNKEDDLKIVEAKTTVIFNEGNFNSSNATIGIYSTEDSTYSPSAFVDANGFFVGDVLQSVKLYENKYYSVLNGSNVVEVIDADNFSSLETLEDQRIDKPRYIDMAGNTAYLSVWGPYNTDFSLSNSKILVVDLEQMAVVEEIPTKPGVEQVLLAGEKLLVTRNYFGAYNHLTVINTSTNAIEADIALPSGPEELFLDAAGNPWVACSSGALVQIDLTNYSLNTLSLEGEIFGDVDIVQDDLYFIQAGNVKKVNLNSQEITTVVPELETAILYSFAVNPTNLDLYIGDGVDYGAEGKVYHYNSEGALVQEFGVGIFPTQFDFK